MTAPLPSTLGDCSGPSAPIHAAPGPYNPSGMQLRLPHPSAMPLGLGGWLGAECGGGGFRTPRPSPAVAGELFEASLPPPPPLGVDWLPPFYRGQRGPSDKKVLPPFQIRTVAEKGG